MEKFKDLQQGAHIYLIEISTQKIISFPIKYVKGLRNKTIQIIYYNILPRQNVSNQQVIDSAKETGQLEDLPTQTLILPMESGICITIENPPRVFGASKENLEQWMKKSL